MAQFDVRYLDGAQIVKERITADSEDEVLAGAAVRGGTLLSVNQLGTGLKKEIGGPKPVKPADLNQFVRMLATMIDADLPMLQTLQMLADEMEHPTLRDAVKAVATDVEAGGSLAVALERHPQIFPTLLISTVDAAEGGGFMGEALESVATSLEEQDELNANIKQATS